MNDEKSFDEYNKPRLVENLDAKTFEQNLKDDKDAILIDVRTPMENQTKRIPNSLLIDISNPQFLSEIGKLDKNNNYYLYCHSGSRSFVAGMHMISLGFSKVSHLQSGITGWNGETEP